MDSFTRGGHHPNPSRFVKNPFLLMACFLLAAFPPSSAGAQNNSSGQLPMTELSLNDMKAFRKVAGNWRIVGDVSGDLDKKYVLTTSPGKGVLVNLPDDKQKDNLMSTFEHGDIDLEFDFMMAKGSNSGVYLQGRYEVQLLDSWGVKNPKYGDVGGIYERWDDSKPEGQQGYQGYAPRMNAAKAPGLWQNLKISFQAPRFDGNGRKTANARMLLVQLNGVTIHENVELTGPTRGGMEGNEKAMGPLLIQGDHGPVAFRSIRYKTYKTNMASVSNLKYSYFPGKFEQMPDLKTLKAEKEGTTPELTWNLVRNPEDRFIMRITGNLQVPEKGKYRFSLLTGGWANLNIANKTVIDQISTRGGSQGVIELKAGDNPFEIIYQKPEPWMSPALGFSIEGPGLRLQDLHSAASVPMRNPVDPILANVQGNNRILRSFVDYRKEPSAPPKRITHAVSVGSADQISYTFDLNTGALVYVWKGGFLDATPMWNSRGDGSSRPMGSVVGLGASPILSSLSDRNAAWPDTINPAHNFRSRGYDLDENENPIFRYTISGVEVEDVIRPEENGRYLTREIRLAAPAPANLFSRIAEGRDITEVSAGLYAVDGKAYFVRVPGEAKATVRKAGNRSELLVPVSGNGMKYSIIW